VSYLTESEIDALQLTALPRDTAYMITGVSHTQFSIARHYGGISWNTHYYRYIPETDELVRRARARSRCRCRGSCCERAADRCGGCALPANLA
jgi:hypothetical protein